MEVGLPEVQGSHWPGARWIRSVHVWDARVQARHHATCELFPTAITIYGPLATSKLLLHGVYTDVFISYMNFNNDTGFDMLILKNKFDLWI